MKREILLLVVGILLLAIGVGLWQVNIEHEVITGYDLMQYNEKGVLAREPIYGTKGTVEGQAVGLGLAVIGLGSTVTGLALLLKKQD